MLIDTSQGAQLLVVCEPTPGTDGTRLRCNGDLDLATTEQLDAHVRRLVASGCHAVTLDLRALTFFDCSGLRLLMKLKLDAATDGWTLTLLYGDGPVQRLFELTDTSAWFTPGA